MAKMTGKTAATAEGSKRVAGDAPDDVVAQDAGAPAAEVQPGDDGANPVVGEAADVSPAPAVPAGHVVVRFVRDHEVQDENRGTKNATIYSCGAELPLPEASAQHFVSRGIAERI